MRPAAIFLPTPSANTPERGRARGALNLKAEARARGTSVRSGACSHHHRVERLPPVAGDWATQWMCWIHEGSHSGPISQSIVFLSGIFPLVFAATGVIMWWRGRCARRELAANRATGHGELQAAE